MSNGPQQSQRTNQSDNAARPERAGRATLSQQAFRQPWLHGMKPLVHAPAQFWSNGDGSVDGGSLTGFYMADTRILSAVTPAIPGCELVPVAWSSRLSDASITTLLVRGLHDAGVDPRVRLIVRRGIGPGGLEERLVIENGLDHDLDVPLELSVVFDMASMQEIKGGVPSSATGNIEIRRSNDQSTGQPTGQSVESSADQSVTAVYRATHARLTARNARIAVDGDRVTLFWSIHVPSESTAQARWRLSVDAGAQAVVAAPDERPWGDVHMESPDVRLTRWVRRSLNDLDGLRMTVPSLPEDQFLAAGAPWFFTLFGRDSLWAARFMLPLGTGLAEGTLRTLAHFQARRSDAATEADPGKIMHELRAEPLTSVGAFETGVMQLPPLYYGTADATELWVTLLSKAIDWGMPDSRVEPLLGNLEAALGWIRQWGDSDGDGFLEYVDRTGHGLSNQGWKDSGDSVRWRDGTLAQGPIALCEVQGYAYQAAMLGAGILERFNRPGAGRMRDWAQRLKHDFNEHFWVEDGQGPYPAIALDARKRPVDSLTSNIGHLLGTGILDREGVAHVASRLMGDDLLSGYGIRTLSRRNAGYSPMSYHCGSVWVHDTAIAMLGLAEEGYRREALTVAEQLVRAAELFDYQTPELYSGDGPEHSVVPYPAACHPQAWSSAASIAVLSTVMGMEPVRQSGGEVGVSMKSPDQGTSTRVAVAGRSVSYR